MPAEKNDAYRAGRLIQWGLRTRARPVQEPEYLELIRQYFDSSEFRTAVRHTADGLGLKILDATEHGLFLSPIPDSVFALKPADFRPGHSSVDDRLLVAWSRLPWRPPSFLDSVTWRSRRMWCDSQ